MGQFKPMTKMETTEPSVILKLKKGGKVKAKQEEHGHMAMHDTEQSHKMHEAMEAEEGCAPKKPSMAERRKAMNPNLYKGGGKVAHKALGGGMPMAGRGGVNMMPQATGRSGGINPNPMMGGMGPAAIAQLAPAIQAARAAQVKRALTGMKKGGSASMSEIKKLERELHHHEKLSASRAHGMKHKASGGAIENNEKSFVRTKMVDGQHHDRRHGTGNIKEGRAGGYKMGGTIEGNEGKFKNTKVNDGDHNDPAHGTSGVRMGNAGGFKKGGRMTRKAVGGVTAGMVGKPMTTMTPQQMLQKMMPPPPPPLPKNPPPAGDPRISDYVTIPVKKGGGIRRKAAGGAIEGNEMRFAQNNVNGTPKGKTNTKTGEVHESNAGGFRHGGHASKKAYATGGNVVSDGKAVKMPRHFVSKPVANSMQSGTFKRGGKVKHHEDGGNIRVMTEAEDQALTDANQKGRKTWEDDQRRENKADQNMLPNMMRKAVRGVKNFFSTTPAGGVTRTTESTTVMPEKRRGGGGIQRKAIGGAVSGTSTQSTAMPQAAPSSSSPVDFHAMHQQNPDWHAGSAAWNAANSPFVVNTGGKLEMRSNDPTRTNRHPAMVGPKVDYPSFTNSFKIPTGAGGGINPNQMMGGNLNLARALMSGQKMAPQQTQTLPPPPQQTQTLPPPQRQLQTLLPPQQQTQPQYPQPDKQPPPITGSPAQNRLGPNGEIYPIGGNSGQSGQSNYQFPTSQQTQWQFDQQDPSTIAWVAAGGRIKKFR